MLASLVREREKKARPEYGGGGCVGWKLTGDERCQKNLLYQKERAIKIFFCGKSRC